MSGQAVACRVRGRIERVGSEKVCDVRGMNKAKKRVATGRMAVPGGGVNLDGAMLMVIASGTWRTRPVG